MGDVMIAGLLDRYIRIALGDEGATAVEYAILASLIGGVIVLVVTGIGSATNGQFQTMVDLWP